MSGVIADVNELEHSVKEDVKLTLNKICKHVEDIIQGDIETAKRTITQNLELHIKALKDELNSSSKQGGGRRKSRNKKGKKGTRRR